MARRGGGARRGGERGGSAPGGAGAGHDDALAAEQVLLGRARAALARGQVEVAEAAVARHARRFAAGQLVEARELLRIQILVRRGRLDDARAAALRFRERFPGSLLGPALDDALVTPAAGGRP
ncbi:MAG: hypothetical protein H6701_12930 [Myxococcales bacterium]|nr:hypothetical protein [Myxococcales bacterium]